MTNQRLAANRKNWDARVPVHLSSSFYDVDRFVADPDHVSDVVRFDAQRLGDVRGQRLLHLQCHIGTDSISWARLGAEVTGLDFSEAAVTAARDLATRAETPARFVARDVYAARKALEGETFDIVYASVGVLCWIPHIANWVEVAASLVGAGGRLYLRDDHPVLFAVDGEREDGLLVLRYPYFETAQPTVVDATTSYTGDRMTESVRAYEWNHGLSEVIQAFLDAGLTLERVEEHRAAQWRALPDMVELADGRFAMRESRDLVPLEFSLLGRRPR